MTRIFFIIIAFFLSLISIAQNIDSLKLALKSANTDTTKINILLKLVENISDDAVWPKYNDLMLKISERLVNTNNITIAKKAKKGLADAYNNIGFMYNNQGDIPNALEFFSKSLKMQEELGFKDGIAELLSNIGVIYYSQNELARALEYYLKSLKIREEIGDKNSIANSLNNIGNLFYTQNNMTRALYYSNRSLKLQEEIGDEEGMAYSLNNLGSIYFNKGNLNNALIFYERSKAMRKKIGDQQGIAASLHNIATIYLKQSSTTFPNNQKELSLAFLYIDSSLVLSKKLKFPANIRNAERLFARVDSAKNNFAGAYEHYKQYVCYKDSVNNEANYQASIKSQIKYVFEKKEAVLKEQQAKERELVKERSRVQRIIIWAVIVGLIIVLLFTFFIYRSLRQNKKASKIIIKQKKMVEDKNIIIEEKQKEIIESIHYAKRIQQTLITSEHYIAKQLKRLKKG